MASSLPTSWSLRQRFAWRPSTFLLAYLAAFGLAHLLQPFLPAALQSLVTRAQDSLGQGALLVPIPASILAMAYFFGSLARKNPQVQFLVEGAVAIGFLWVVLATG